MHCSGLSQKRRHDSTGICRYFRFMFLKSKVQLSCSDLCLDHSCHQSKKREKSKEIQKFFFTDNLENQNAIVPHNLIELFIKLTIPPEKVYKFCDPLTDAGVKILKKKLIFH